MLLLWYTFLEGVLELGPLELMTTGVVLGFSVLLTAIVGGGGACGEGAGGLGGATYWKVLGGAVPP